ncbi:MAG: hypothetical protein Q7T70_12620 [Polaromonas sp.]|nr:hypothetical protein [Polaromonas sp.]
MIYMKTELGQTAFQTRSIALTPRQRSAFILFDGKRSTDEVLKSTAGLNVTADDIDHLVAQGLLAPSAGSAPAAAAVLAPEPAGAPGAPTLSAQEHYSRAYPIATRLTAALGLRGFRLNLAVEAAGNLAELQELAPKIKEAVGPEKFKELQNALYY